MLDGALDRRAVRADGVRLFAPDGSTVERPVEVVDWDAEEAEKGGFETFMLKEIHEQPDALAETLADRTARPTTSGHSLRAPTSTSGWSADIATKA